MTWHKKDTPWDDDRWELYHTDVDFTESNDLAAKNPEKLEGAAGALVRRGKEVQRPAARRSPVRTRRRPDPAGRGPREEAVHVLSRHLDPAPAWPRRRLLGKEHTITALVEIPEDGAEGVLACSGGEFGGWTLFLKDGKFHYVHNYLKLERVRTSSSGRPCRPGKHTLSVHFTPTENAPKAGLLHRAT